MGGFEAFNINMGVNLGRGDIRMPQHHLHRAQIRAASEQMGGKRVAEHVGTYCLMNTGFERHLLDYLPKSDSGHGCAAIGEKEIIAGLAFQEKGAGLFNVFLQNSAGKPRKRHNPLLVAFAEDAEMTIVEVAPIDRQFDKLRDTQSRGIEKMQHGQITDLKRRKGFAWLQQGVDLSH